MYNTYLLRQIDEMPSGSSQKDSPMLYTSLPSMGMQSGKRDESCTNVMMIQDDKELKYVSKVNWMRKKITFYSVVMEAVVPILEKEMEFDSWILTGRTLTIGEN